MNIVAIVVLAIRSLHHKISQRSYSSRTIGVTTIAVLLGMSSSGQSLAVSDQSIIWINLSSGGILSCSLSDWISGGAATTMTNCVIPNTRPGFIPPSIAGARSVEFRARDLNPIRFESLSLDVPDRVEFYGPTSLIDSTITADSVNFHPISTPTSLIHSVIQARSMDVGSTSTFSRSRITLDAGVFVKGLLNLEESDIQSPTTIVARELDPSGLALNRSRMSAEHLYLWDGMVTAAKGSTVTMQSFTVAARTFSIDSAVAEAVFSDSSSFDTRALYIGLSSSGTVIIGSDFLSSAPVNRSTSFFDSIVVEGGEEGKGSLVVQGGATLRRRTNMSESLPPGVAVNARGMVDIRDGVIDMPWDLSQAYVAKDAIWQQSTPSRSFLHIGPRASRDYYGVPSLEDERGYAITVGGSGATGFANEGTVSLVGKGRFIRVEEGYFFQGPSAELSLSVVGRPRGLQTLLPNDNALVNSGVYLGGKIRVDLSQADIKEPGETVAIAVAGRVTATALRNGYAREWRADNGAVSFGDLAVDVSRVRDSNMYMVPEMLKVGCNGFSSILLPCAEALSLRAVTDAQKAANTAPALPRFDVPGLSPTMSLGLASSFVGDARVQTLGVLARVSYLGGEGTGFEELSRIELDGLAAYAYRVAYGGGDAELVIAIRGTAGSPFSAGNGAANWAANLGFLPDSIGATPVLRAYVQNLSAFTASVLAANPDSDITYTGHSLGGGLSLIMGAATGERAVAFNAPGVGHVLQAFPYMGNELAAFGVPAGEPDPFSLINVRVPGDPVSANVGGDLGPREMGTLLTLRPSATEYAIANPSWSPSFAFGFDFAKLSAQFFRNARVYHSLDYVLQRILDGDVCEISLNDQVIASDGCAPHSLADLANRVFMPEAGNALVKRFSPRPVVGGGAYFLDPVLERGLEFDAANTSPRFLTVRAPDLGLPNLRFSIWTLTDGQWTLVGELDPNEEFLFDGGGVHRFRVLVDPEQVADLDLSQVFFAVTFDRSGVFEGSITPVPEPSTVAMVMMGLMLLVAVQKRQGWRVA